ncbi:MAG: hypothetical protein ACI4T8_02685 [Christensenellales bacterium]
MKRIYYIIGRIIEKTQLTESLLGDVVKYCEIYNEYARHKTGFNKKDYNNAVSSAEYLKTKMETMTLGSVVHVIWETRAFTRAEIDELKFILERRNYFVHEYFKYTPFDEISKNETELVEEYNALKEYYLRLETFYKKAEIYLKSYKQKCERIIVN